MFKRQTLSPEYHGDLIDGAYKNIKIWHKIQEYIYCNPFTDIGHALLKCVSMNIWSILTKE